MFMFYSLKIMVMSQVAKASSSFSLFLTAFVGLITDQSDRKQKKCRVCITSEQGYTLNFPEKNRFESERFLQYLLNLIATISTLATEEQLVPLPGVGHKASIRGHIA